MKKYLMFLETKKQNIWDSISRNNIKEVEEYINDGGDLDIIKSDFLSDDHTLLTYAINHETENNNKIVKILLDAGCDPYKTDRYGNTTLITAVFYDNLEITKILIYEYNVDINKRNINYISALTESIKHSNINIFSILLENSADFSSKEIEALYNINNILSVNILKEKYPKYYNSYNKYAKQRTFNL
jgi:ankyrin repeat protein